MSPCRYRTAMYFLPSLATCLASLEMFLLSIFIAVKHSTCYNCVQPLHISASKHYIHCKLTDKRASTRLTPNMLQMLTIWHPFFQIHACRTPPAMTRPRSYWRSMTLSTFPAPPAGLSPPTAPTLQAARLACATATSPRCKGRTTRAC